MRDRVRITVIGCLLVAVILIWLWLGGSHKFIDTQRDVTSSVASTAPPPQGPPPQGKSSITAKKQVPRNAQHDELHRKETVSKIVSALATAITFYGRVIDQNGDPVVNATIYYTALDKFDQSGSKYQGESNANGDFSISGIRGAALNVGVRKDGYYPILDRSNASFAYGIGPDSTRKGPPTANEPAVFVLQKRGISEPLIRAEGGQIDVPRTGEPLTIDLATGRPGRGDLRIETWVGDSSQRRFDWRYRLSVPGGGLAERKGQFDFEAPSVGYQPFVEVNMPASSEQWSSDVPKQYFAILPSGKYARFSIEFYAGDRNFIVFESYLNPKPGSRNLEFDPQKTVKVR